jgi:hypothetical protein
LDQGGIGWCYGSVEQCLVPTGTPLTGTCHVFTMPHITPAQRKRKRNTDTDCKIARHHARHHSNAATITE